MGNRRKPKRPVPTAPPHEPSVWLVEALTNAVRDAVAVLERGGIGPKDLEQGKIVNLLLTDDAGSDRCHRCLRPLSDPFLSAYTELVHEAGPVFHVHYALCMPCAEREGSQPDDGDTVQVIDREVIL